MNLLSKLHRNSILTGPIENYCLVCGCLLRSEEESYAHIHEPSHVDKLKSVPQLVDYNDCIIKIKEGYFCRYCNIILPTIKRVGIHVTESKHSDNKISLSISRHNGVILAFDTVIINDRSWNGLDGSTCSVCNEDYDDEEEHKKGSTHVLNLIQIKCEFGETYVYRKVDEELFFCLICNAILPLLEKQTHHQSEKHLELFEKSKEEGTSIRNKNVSAIETNNNVAASPNELNNSSVKPPTSQPKNNQILDTKKANDGKPKAHDNKAQNGSDLDINDNKARSPKNTIESATLNAEKVFNFEATVPAKSDSQANGTQKASNLTYSSTIITNTQGIKDSKNKNSPTQTIKTEKVNTASEQISNESKHKNTVAKNADTKNSEAAKVKVEVDKVPKAIVNNEVNGTAKNQSDKAEPYLYEFLKARNFVIKTRDDTAYCTICDLNINEPNIKVHHRDEHHRILYSKHIARKTKLSNLDSGNERETSRSLSNSSEACGKLKANKSKAAVDKENVAPVSGQKNKNATSEANGKLVEAKGKIVAKKSKENVTPVSGQKDKNATSEVNAKLVEAKESKENVALVSGQKDKNATSEANGKAVKAKGKEVAKESKENVAPVSGQKDENATSEANGKLVEAKGKEVAKESKDTVEIRLKCGCVTDPLTNEKEKHTVSNSVTTEKPATVIEQPINKDIKPSLPENQTKHQKPTDKENAVPENDNNNRKPNPNGSNEKNKGEIKQKPTETTAQNKKAAKKSQKKAAKAKVAETEPVLPKEVNENETALTEACGQRTSETAERGDLKEPTPELLIDPTNVKETTKAESEKEQKVMASPFASEAEIKTERLLSLLKTLSHIDSASDVVVNNKHVLGDLSFVLVLRTGGERAECVACGEHFTVDDVNMHVDTDVHRGNVEDCLVVTSLDDEFIRQVKSQEYHCGYCNMMIPSWDDMERHLTSYGHEDAKTSAAWRLEQYLPLMRLVGPREVRNILTKIFRCTE